MRTVIFTGGHNSNLFYTIRHVGLSCKSNAVQMTQIIGLLLGCI